jgi:hypothetical protein
MALGLVLERYTKLQRKRGAIKAEEQQLATLSENKEQNSETSTLGLGGI